MKRFACVPIFLLAVAAHPAALTVAPAPAEVDLADPRRDTTVRVVEKVLPSVVNIATTELRQVSDPFRRMIMQLNGQRPVEKRLSVGSGVIIDEEGYVLSADHVVRSATEIWLKLADGRERQADQVVLAARSDVALLKIRARPGDKFTPIRLAADDDLLLGETVLSLGNPFGLGGSVSRGILSSKNRRPPPEAEQLGPGDWLQTDAAINPGSSGGPLVNLRGELIGLNAAIYPDAQGIGFAIPIRAVTDSVSGLINPERARGLWFGAQLKPRRGAESELGGVLVSEVQPGSPAGKAGLKVGDLVTMINGKSPRTFISFSLEIIFAPKEQPLTLGVKRDGRDLNLKVQMVEEAEFFNAALIRTRMGAQLGEMTADAARWLGLRQPEGLVVSAVEAGSPAAAAGLPRNAVVVRVDDRPVNSVVELAKAVFEKQKGQVLKLNFVLFRQQAGVLFQEEGAASVKLR